MKFISENVRLKNINFVETFHFHLGMDYLNCKCNCCDFNDLLHGFSDCYL